MKKVNELILCRDKYESQEEFENEIKKSIMILLNADNIITVRYDEKGLGIISIEYSSAGRCFGDYYPYWLLPEEYENLISEGYENE